jgi:hypothetical protein
VSRRIRRPVVALDVAHRRKRARRCLCCWGGLLSRLLLGVGVEQRLHGFVRAGAFRQMIASMVGGSRRGRFFCAGKSVSQVDQCETRMI